MTRTAPHDLVTDRLALRTWTAADVSAVLAGRRMPGWAADFPAEGDRAIAAYIAEHPAALEEFGQRQIIERETGEVVGAIGLFWPPSDEGSLEFGYGVVESRRGRGYATEAARAIVEFARTAPGVDEVFATVDPANPASVRVLANLGLDRLPPNGDGLLRFRTPRDTNRP